MKKTALILFIAILISLTGCESHYTASAFLMDTVVTFDVIHPDAKRLTAECEALTEMLEASLSAHIETSEVARFNKGEAIGMSDDLTALVALSQKVAVATDGAYDITVAPLVKLWNISHADSSWQPPTNEAIAELLPLVGYESLTVEGSMLTANEGMQIDLGGIGKGYALGACAELLADRGADGMISFGGNIALVGEKSDGTEWRVGIKNPMAPETILGVITVPSGIVAVSGGYERFTEYEGVRYHHILDPKTGAPSASDIASAAVWVGSADAESGALADALSTALFVMGSERSAELYHSNIFEFEYVLTRGDGSTITSDGLTERFTKE